jgi:type I restriction enzyme, R subunit
VPVSFADFDFAELGRDEQTFENYKSKYLDIYDKVRSDHDKEKTSILEEVDFELELVRRDEINVSYILRLIGQMVGANEQKQSELRKIVMDTIQGDIALRSKQELIEKFIQSTLPNITEADDIEKAFSEFWGAEQQAAFEKLCQAEGLNPESTQALLERYLFSGRQPRDDDIGQALLKQPSILKRHSIISSAKKRFEQFIETFVQGV